MVIQHTRVKPPSVFRPLYQPRRYKVLYGGRGSAKSWQVADYLIVSALEKKIRIGCFREIQDSIKDSVHRLLRDRIEALGLLDLFDITDRSITCKPTGSNFLFEGLFRNVNRIKSLEGIDKAWVEEAESVSDESWDILIPTIRKPDSEIIVSFNPQYEDDATYQRFVVNPPEGAWTQHLTYEDNPYFPDVLRREMEQDKARDKAKYETIWLGQPKGGGRRVWPAFDREQHLKEIPMEQIAKEGNCYMAMDPHSHYYPFCVWVAVLPKNQRKAGPEDFYRHIYAEWPTFGDLDAFYHDVRKKILYKDTLADMARQILAKDGSEFGIKIKERFIDTRFAKGSGSWNWSTQTVGIVEQFAKRENGGLSFTLPQEKSIDAQRQAIHADMLWNQLQPRSPFNEPSFTISPKCKNLIASLSNHRLEEDSEKEDEKFKDPSDALRICYAGFGDRAYIDPTGTPVRNYAYSGNSEDSWLGM